MAFNRGNRTFGRRLAPCWWPLENVLKWIETKTDDPHFDRSEVRVDHRNTEVAIPKSPMPRYEEQTWRTGGLGWYWYFEVAILWVDVHWGPRCLETSFSSRLFLGT